jgi:hypothetical protein
MIQWKMGGFKVALISPWVDGVGDPTVDVTIPKIEASYSLKGDMFFVDIIGGYQTYTLDGGNGGTDYDVDSYVGIIGAGVNFGALYIKANAHMGQNLGNYGGYNPLDFDDEAVISGTEIKDTDAYGVMGVIGFNASEMLTIEGGVGMVNYEKDTTGAEDETGMQYYLNAVINIAPGFFIVPEVGYITADYDSGGATPDPEPSRTYFGAKWQINF